MMARMCSMSSIKSLTGGSRVLDATIFPRTDCSAKHFTDTSSPGTPPPTTQHQTDKHKRSPAKVSEERDVARAESAVGEKTANKRKLPWNWKEGRKEFQRGVRQEEKERKRVRNARLREADGREDGKERMDKGGRMGRGGDVIGD
ncbi:hypothetical protein HDV00_011470 [Rhizophlyctis rosea]|nr:hypothetical protein HDV00_011470 [Rhizophlyctis rosea]